jgi:hypothetical protein
MTPTSRTVPTPSPPVVLDPALADVGLVHRLIDEHAPYWPVQRYFSNSAEYAALSGNAPGEMVVAPVFRGNWATEGQVRPGVEPILHDERLVDAARRVFGASVVRPHTVYVNLTWQLPFAQGAGHTDVPAFRGFDRRDWPISFLSIMGLSGLFEDVRVKIATGVGWFYAGEDGGFEYWPDGPDRPSVIHEGAIDNTMIVADNDFMWHRVRPTGRPEDGMPRLTLESELVRRSSSEWAIVDDGTTVAEVPRDRLRVSLSWKADVFLTDDDARRHDDHVDDIDLGGVLDRFVQDLRARGVEPVLSDDPVRDPTFIALLQEHYVRYPSTSSAA